MISEIITFLQGLLFSHNYRIRFSLYDAIPSRFKGDGAAADWYVSYDKGSSFLDLVSSLSSCLEGNTLLWIDMIILGGRGPLGKSAAEACDNTESIQSTMLKGTVLVLDRHCHVITTTWNLYECYLAMRQQQSSFCVATPDGLGHQDILRFFSLFGKIDISKSTPDGRVAERPEVVGRVRQKWGLARASKEFPEALRKALFVRLRWKSSRADDIANTACLLYHRNELLQLQLFLQNIDMGKIVDGDVMKNIFQMYDTDGSGSIDLDELIAGLTNAGYTESECIEIFHEIDTDNSMFITFPEFEHWFERQKKGQGDSAAVAEQMVAQKKSDVSYSGLVTKLEVVIAFAARNKLESHIEYLKDARMAVEAKMRKAALRAKEGSLAWSRLPTQPLKDFLLHEAASKLAAKDYKGSTLFLYGQLSKMPELLDFDPNLLQLPYSEGSGATSKEHMQLSCIYLGALARILQFREQHHPLELEFCVFCLAELLEQWGMGICKAYFKRSKSLLDGSRLSTHPLITSDEKLMLAQALMKIRSEDDAQSLTKGSEISIGTRYNESVSKVLLTEPVSSIQDLRIQIMSKFDGNDRGIGVLLKRSLSRSLSRSRSSHPLPGLEGSFGALEGLQSHLSGSLPTFADNVDDESSSVLLDMDGSKGFKQMTEVLKEDQPQRLSVLARSSNGAKPLGARISIPYSLRPSAVPGFDIPLSEEAAEHGSKSAQVQAITEVDLADLLDRKMTKSPKKPPTGAVVQNAAEDLPGLSSFGQSSPQERKKEKRGALGDQNLISRIAEQLASKVPAAVIKR